MDPQTSLYPYHLRTLLWDWRRVLLMSAVVHTVEVVMVVDADNDDDGPRRTGTLAENTCW